MKPNSILTNPSLLRGSFRGCQAFVDCFDKLVSPFPSESSCLHYYSPRGSQIGSSHLFRQLFSYFLQLVLKRVHILTFLYKLKI